jgi:hypothetical protein
MYWDGIVVGITERYRDLPLILLRTFVYNSINMLDNFAKEHRGCIGKVLRLRGVHGYENPKTPLNCQRQIDVGSQRSPESLPMRGGGKG